MASRTVGLTVEDVARVREIESLARQLAYLCLPERRLAIAPLTKLYGAGSVPRAPRAFE